MRQTPFRSGREPGITKTLIADFKQFFHNPFAGQVRQQASRSFRELRRFYLSEEQEERLASMGRIKRWFLTDFWLLKEMLLKLSPVRRMMQVSGNGVGELSKGEPALGLTPDTRYREQRLDLKQSELLIVYSDGVTEACNEAEEFFGEERLFAQLNEPANTSSAEMGERIVAAVVGFVGQAPRTNDLLLAIVRPV